MFFQRIATAALFLALPSLYAAEPNLPRRYRDWVDGPVSYLITKTERAAFLILRTDADRDAFIDRFWELRNSAPGSANNAFKDEFYRRLAYVNSFFGNDGGTDGWRTDRGRTYLLFGKPQNTTNFKVNQELYPTELWFYSNPGLSELPPFFYVLFFDRDGIGGYHFYQPAVDGPDKLMRAGPSPQQAYQYLRQLNSELAQATLTLIPGEPVDTQYFSGSLGSQTIVNAAEGYNQMPSYVALIEQRALRLERVTSKVHYDVSRTGLLTFVVWEKGQPWLHWQLSIQDIQKPKAAKGQLKYEITTRLSAGGRPVFERTDAPSAAVPAGSEDSLKTRPFVFEDRIPVAEGKFRLSVTARNVAADATYEASRDFTVESPTDRAELSDIVIVSRYEPDRRPRPFQFGGIKFFPDPTSSTSATRGLRICYQVAVRDAHTPALDVEYVIGNMGSQLRKTFEDKLDLRTADPFGTLITGKTLSTDELPPGNYQVVVRIKNPENGSISARSARFQIADNAGEIQPIVISQGHAETPQWLAANDYERALCWLSQGRSREAVRALEASLKNSQNPAVQGLLQHLYETTGGPSR